ncbi:dihydroxyacetone kinase family protein [Ancylobacter amanitiformis]|uniref:Dihydroxyacetone kinase-like protein n=1 Tax=Ancylobacter amanitiformis TaxID=217069 RepID=A0ABU0LTZ3_9HYPH|nr:dihydroxyacetone kinase subunit L [Ancylobacter amanitiformis]MDQ0512144.1 dihydroxyacetone kinase-like protein [Ancylobacter amanitiformis]
MDAIRAEDLISLIRAWRDMFAVQRDFLIALDGKVGDSDLGITMAKAFAAAYDTVAAEGPEAGLSKLLRGAGATMAKTAPSTMGTLTATGFLRGAKALEGKDTIGTPELAAFWRAYATGIAERGKARLGDKTILDVLDPVAGVLEAQAASGAALAPALKAAADEAEAALERTRTMVAQHGKAAAFQEKTVGLQDAGATVGVLLVKTMSEVVAG